VLQGAVIGIDDEDDSTFTITVDQSRSYYFQGEYSAKNIYTLTLLISENFNAFLCDCICSVLNVFHYFQEDLIVHCFV